MDAPETNGTLPVELTSAMRWVVWRRIVRDGKADKPPYDFRTGRPGDVTDPAVWSSYPTAVAEAASGGFDGVGYVFTPADRITGIDLDRALDARGVPHDWAMRVVHGLDSYTEISPSGTGLHIFVRGGLAGRSRHKVGGFGPDGTGAVEVYDRGRYFTVTDRHLAGTPRAIEERQEELDAFCREWFPPANGANGANGKEAEPRPGDCDDEFVLRMARTSKGHERFCRLYDDGEITGFESHSNADLSLCSRLAFWTGGKAAAVDRLFRRSALMRDKWDRRSGAVTYGERTIAVAMQGHSSFFDAGTDPDGDEAATEEATATTATDWEPPILDESLPAEPFPLDVLPPELGFLVFEAGQCLTCPADFPAFAALCVAGGAIGRTLAVKVKESWAESPTIYGAIVARPGSTKSSALSLITRPLWVLSEELLAKYRRDIERHKIEQAQEGAVPGPAPVLARVVVNDTTCEALAPLLAENPHGLIMVRDELTAWVAGLNQYKAGGRGSDRQFFLSAWSGTPVTVDRKGDRDKGPIHIPHPFLCVVGSLTPDMLGELADERGRDDGFLDRLLFAFPEPVKIRWNPEAVSEDSLEAWTQAVRRLHARHMTEDARGHPCPRFARMSPEALARYAAWFNDHETESEQDDFPRHMVGVWSKLKAYCARFALILDQLHRVYDPTDDGSDVTIGLASVERAIRLTDYFKNHCRRVRGLLRGAVGENPDARAILKWVLHGERAEFSERDVRKNFPGRFGGPESDLVHALGWLKARHLIRPVAPAKPRDGSSKPPAKAGRPATPRYEVNPALLGGGGSVHSDGSVHGSGVFRDGSTGPDEEP